MSDYLELFNLTKVYDTPNGPAVIVRNFNLRIRKGEFVCLIGHSGCGKSTVLSMVAGLNSITDGGIILAGRELTGPGPDRGMVFQSPCLLPWMTALENVMLGVNQVFFTAHREERHQIAEYYLSVVGLVDAMHKKPLELSQGMRQRVGIARAFALSPKMLLLDEPFGMLDSLTRMELQQVLIDLWRKDKKTALMVTHDVDEALFLADRVVMMTNGPEAEVGDILTVEFPRPRERKAVLAHPEYYTLRERLIGFLEAHACKSQAPSLSEGQALPPSESRIGEGPACQPTPDDALLISSNRMKTASSTTTKATLNTTSIAASLLVLAAINQIYAQYAPPPPPQPFAGLINEHLRKDDPYMNRWDFGGSARVRYEIRDNFGIPGVGTGATTSLDFRRDGADVDNAYLLERFRLRAGYTDKSWSALVEGRSSLAQSDERFASTGPVRRNGEGPEQDSIDLHQAYATLGNHKEFPLSLKVGRQELSYGEERLVGAFAWNNIGRVFDAAKVRLQTDWFWSDFFASRVVIPEDGRFNVSNDYDWFSGFYASTTKIPKHTLDLYFLSRNASPEAAFAEPSPQFPQPSARDIYTTGVRLKSQPGKLGNWDYTLDLIGQLGNFRDPRAGAPTERLDHEAYAFIAQGGYTFKDAWGTPRLGLEYSHGSGDDDPQDGKHGTFENLFPTNHKFYGYADTTSLQNLHNVRMILQLKPHARVSAAIEGHLLWLADTDDSFYNVGGVARGGTATTPGTGYGVNPGNSSFLGSELDVVAGWAMTKFSQLEAGYAHFFVGDYIRESLSAPTHGSTDANWFYVQLNVTF